MSRLRPLRGRTRRSRFLFLSLFLVLLSLAAGAIAACTEDGTGAGEPELPEVEQTVAVELEQPPAPAQQSARSSVARRSTSTGVELSAKSPANSALANSASSSKGGSRRVSPARRSIGSTTSPHTARHAAKHLRKRLSSDGSTIQVSIVHEWLDEMLADGHIPPQELMKAVIAVTSEGVRFVDRTVPSTRTDLLRRAANQLSIGSSDLRRLAQEVKGDPLLAHQGPSGGAQPFQSELHKDYSTREKRGFRTPSPGPQMLTPTASSPEPFETSGWASASDASSVPDPVEPAEVFETPESVGTQAPLTTPLPELEVPTSDGPKSEGSSEGDEFEHYSPPQSNWLMNLEELLRASPPPTPSPQTDEPLQFSPETQKLLASIPSLPGKPIPESTKELLDYSPYVGVAPKWMPSLDEEPVEESRSGLLSPTDASDEPIDDLAKQVDDIIAELQEPSEAEYQLVSGETSPGLDTKEGPYVEGMEASSPVGKWSSPLDKVADGLMGGREPENEGSLLEDGSRQPLGTSEEAVQIPLHQPDKNDESLPQTSSLPMSKGEAALELPPLPLISIPACTTGSRCDSLKARHTPLTTDVQSSRPRLWERTKAAAAEHKTLLKVTGGLAFGALLIAGFVALNRRLHRRLPISSPLISTVEPKKCHVLVDFAKGRRLKAMGRVASVERVEVNNTSRTLTVEYLEKPALQCSRGREIFNWFKYFSSFGRNLVRRVEQIRVPDSCMAGPYSKFQVKEDKGASARLLVDLDMNPGPLAVPRELMEATDLEELLSNYGKDPTWKVYDDCVMHITIDRPFRGSPIVVVESARARVGFQNPELQHLSSPLPRECDWMKPWTLRIAYKSNNGGPVDLLLLMSAAVPPLEETIVLDREAGDAALDDPDDILEDIRGLFGE